MVYPVINIKNLSVSYEVHNETVEVVQGVTLSVNKGECVGIVGESGSGKSQTFLSSLQLIPENGRATGEVIFDNKNLLALSNKELNQIRGSAISMIFQDPLTALASHLTVGEQMMEVLTVHQNLSKAQAKNICIDWLHKVRINEAEQRFKQYPHQLSGGMRQRVMIAMAMVCEPTLLVADEPTTALDVTVQSEILDILESLKRDFGLAIVFITHDMGVAARICDRIYVMNKGKVLEQGTVDDIFYNSQTPYAKMLLTSMPTLAGESPKPLSKETERILEVKNLEVSYSIKSSKLFQRSRYFKAVNGIDLHIHNGETLGIVGESGCGKSTLARAILRLVDSNQTRISWLGRNISNADKQEIRALRKELQIIFQDPLASLNPRRTISQSIYEPLQTFNPEMNSQQRKEKTLAIMQKVGLAKELYNRYPHELSGGQNQRVGIARAIILNPKLVICDEAVSALDVSIQNQVIHLLQDLQKELQLSLIFISHNLSVVKQISHRIMVMYMGSILEIASSDTLINSPQHPYTKQLISAVPIPDPKLEKDRKRIYLKGELTSPLDPLAQLRFLPSKNNDVTYRPKLYEVSENHFVAEHDPIEKLV